MPRNGSGTYTPPSNSWNPAVNGVPATAADWQSVLNDIAAALTQSLSRDGQSSITSNLPMSGNKLTGLGPGIAAGDSLRWEQLFSQGLENDVASAATTDIGIINSNFIRITGTTTITSFGANYRGPRFVRFAAGLTLTHNASSLILPTGANITTAAGDTAIVIPKATIGTADGWFVVSYQRASGLPLLQTNSVNNFRLTLTTGLPVTINDVSGATTIYCAPYNGNQISLYSGSSWVLRTSAQFSLSLGTLISGRPYDVFCYDNAGTPTLEFLAWSSDTLRATQLGYQDGVLVKSGDATRRYLGTFYTTSATTTEDSAANRYLWNYYHRAVRRIKKVDDTNSWNYTSLTYREANGGNNRINLVNGLDEDAVSLNLFAYGSNTSASIALVSAIGLDSTTAKASDSPGITVATVAAGVGVAMLTNFNGNVGAGRHSLVWLEASQASGTTTWYGDNGGTLYQTGLYGTCLS